MKRLGKFVILLALAGGLLALAARLCRRQTPQDYITLYRSGD